MNLAANNGLRRVCVQGFSTVYRVIKLCCWCISPTVRKGSVFPKTNFSRKKALANARSSAWGASFDTALKGQVEFIPTQTTGVDLASQRDSLMARYNTGTTQTQSRSYVLRDVTENASTMNANYNPAFVLTEYFGYLRRGADRGGYDFWLNV